MPFSLFLQKTFSRFTSNRHTYGQCMKLLQINYPGLDSHCRSAKTFHFRRRQGTFRQRQEKDLLSWQQHLEGIQDYLVEDSCYVTLRVSGRNHFSLFWAWPFYFCCRSQSVFSLYLSRLLPLSLSLSLSLSFFLTLFLLSLSLIWCR